MPRYDGRGPYGYGPMTGRGAGMCARGRGFGFFQSMPFGFQRAPMTKEDEKSYLSSEKELLERESKAIQEELKAVEQRLKELDKK